MPRNLINITIPVGQTVSNIAQGNGMTLVGLYVPANLTGTTLTFNAYASNGQLPVGLVTDGSGSAVSKTVKATTDQYIDLSTDLVAHGIDGVQVISGSSQSTTPAKLVAVFI